MKLSIITIAYNDLNGLKCTAESVLAQTFTDYEWIVIDGGSSDGTHEYLASLEKQPEFWCSELDCGIYDAMNKGISHANGEWCLFLNSGDFLYDQDVLKRVFSEIPEADIVYCDAVFKGSDKTFNVTYPSQLTLDFFVERCICHQATFIKRQLLTESNGYSTDYKIVSDWRAWVIWIMQGKKFVHLPVVVCTFMLGGIGSTKLQEAKEERERVFEELLPDYVKPLLFNETYNRALEHYTKKIHEQFMKKPLIRASIVLSRNNWFVRKFMQMQISLGCAFDRCFYSKKHNIKYTDDKYDAWHPERFIFNNPL